MKEIENLIKGLTCMIFDHLYIFIISNLNLSKFIIYIILFLKSVDIRQAPMFNMETCSFLCRQLNTVNQTIYHFYIRSNSGLHEIGK